MSLQHSPARRADPSRRPHHLTPVSLIPIPFPTPNPSPSSLHLPSLSSQIPYYLRTSHNNDAPPSPPPAPMPSPSSSADQPTDLPSGKQQKRLSRSSLHGFSSRHHQLIQHEFAMPGSALSPSKSEHWLCQDPYSHSSTYAPTESTAALHSSSIVTTTTSREWTAATDVSSSRRQSTKFATDCVAMNIPPTGRTLKQKTRALSSISLSSSPTLAAVVTTTTTAKAHILSRKSSSSIDNLVRSSAIAAKRNTLTASSNGIDLLSTSAPASTTINRNTLKIRPTLLRNVRSLSSSSQPISRTESFPAEQLYSPRSETSSSVTNFISPTSPAYANLSVDAVLEGTDSSEDEGEYNHSFSQGYESTEGDDEEIERRSITDISKTDVFDSMRRKIADLTYTLQEFQIHELLETEKLERDGRQKQREVEWERTTTENKRWSASTSSVLSGTTLASVSEYPPIASRHSRSSSSCTLCMKPVHTYQAHQCHSHRASSSSLGSLLSVATLATKREQIDQSIPSERDGMDVEDQSVLDSGAIMVPPSPVSRFPVLEDEHPSLSTSPTLTTLFLTTNALLSGRIDELSLSLSAATNARDQISLEWQAQFIDLMSCCITQSEQLEAVSMQLLESERHVRELLSVKCEIDDDLDDREKEYRNRIEEVNQVIRDQQRMTDGLEELMRELEGRVNNLLLMGSGMGPIGTGAIIDQNGEIHRIKRKDKRWSFGDTLREAVKMNEMEEVVARVRSEVGRVIGAGSANRLNNVGASLRSRMSAGNIQPSTPTTPSMPYSPVHRYSLHLSAHDRRTRFTLLPRELWVEDADVDRCQSGEFFGAENETESRKRCGVIFTWFQRRHHCRRYVHIALCLFVNFCGCE
ncbi:hypothetical protein BC936DRAFT_144592 [Jimgerdemannia flammicorona]|uniref:Uncharacterized protein n=1 Tax=Jimgerdemannia flammicorona TaxID=994334 RepID=A0A433DC48_9FUNG|nr:hypothetical protein BC936DRAFT_144592 [Jimgerdemannia flammicorona]